MKMHGDESTTYTALAMKQVGNKKLAMKGLAMNHPRTKNIRLGWKRLSVTVSDKRSSCYIIV